MSPYLKNYTVKLSEICFYLFFAALLFAKGIGLYDGQTWFKIFLVIAMASWIMKQFLTEYTIKEILFVAAVTGLGCLIYFISREKGALLCILLICGMKGINVRRSFQVGLLVWVVSFGGLFLLTSVHILDSHFKVHDKLGLGRIIRWSLGYAHPNVLHISCLVLVCLAVYLLDHKFNVRWFLALEAINLYVFMYSLSATGFLAVNICLILTLYWSIRQKFCRAEQILIQLCLPFCIFLSLVVPVTLKEPLFSIVNKIVNTRLVLSQWFLQNQPAQLFGVDTREIVTSLRTMDNSYVFAYIIYGIVFCVLIVAAYFGMLYHKTCKQDGLALCVILSCLIAGITEPFLFNTSFKNISLIFIGNWVFERGGKGKKLPVFGKLDREFNVSFPDMPAIWREIKKAGHGCGKKLLTLAAAAGILAGIIAFSCSNMPERYIFPRTAFENTNDIEETYYLTSAEDLPEAGDVVMGYVDEQTDMVPFTGNVAVVERFRNTVSAFLLTGLLTWMAGSIFWWKKHTT